MKLKCCDLCDVIHDVTMQLYTLKIFCSFLHKPGELIYLL